MSPLRLLAGLVCVFVLAVPSRASASDGTFTHVLCANPDTGKGVVGANGRLPDGTTNPFNEQAAGVSAALSRCSGTIDGGAGVPVTTGGGWSSASANRGAALRYRAPFGPRVRRRLHLALRDDERALRVDGHAQRALGPHLRHAGRRAVHVGERVLLAGHVDRAVRRRQPRADRQRDDRRAGVRRVRAVRHPRGMVVPGRRVADRARLRRATRARGLLRIRSPARRPARSPPPRSSAAPRTSSSTRRTAGPALYRVRLLVDGAPRLSPVVHENQGRCVDVNPANADAYEFAWQQPCRPVGERVRLLRHAVAARGVARREGPSSRTRRQRRDRAQPHGDDRQRPAAVGGRRSFGRRRDAAGQRAGRRGRLVGRPRRRCARGVPSVAAVPDRRLVVRRRGARAPRSCWPSEDVGRRLRVVERAVNSEGAGEAASAVTDVVTREDGTLPPDRDGVDNDGDGEVDEPGETDPIPGRRLLRPGSGGHTDNPSGLSGTRLARRSARTRLRLVVRGRERRGSVAPCAPLGRPSPAAAPRGRSASAAAPGDRAGSSTSTARRSATRSSTSRAPPRCAAPRRSPGSPRSPAPTARSRYRVDGRASSRTLRFTYRYLRAGDVVADASL